MSIQNFSQSILDRDFLKRGNFKEKVRRKFNIETKYESLHNNAKSIVENVSVLKNKILKQGRLNEMQGKRLLRGIRHADGNLTPTDIKEVKEMIKRMTEKKGNMSVPGDKAGVRSKLSKYSLTGAKLIKRNIREGRRYMSLHEDPTARDDRYETSLDKKLGEIDDSRSANRFIGDVRKKGEADDLGIVNQKKRLAGHFAGGDIYGRSPVAGANAVGVGGTYSKSAGLSLKPSIGINKRIMPLSK